MVTFQKRKSQPGFGEGREACTQSTEMGRHGYAFYICDILTFPQFTVGSRSWIRCPFLDARFQGTLFCHTCPSQRPTVTLPYLKGVSVPRCKTIFAFRFYRVGAERTRPRRREAAGAGQRKVLCGCLREGRQVRVVPDRGDTHRADGNACKEFQQRSVLTALLVMYLNDWEGFSQGVVNRSSACGGSNELSCR